MSFRIWASNYKRSERKSNTGDYIAYQVYGNNDFPTEIHDYLENKGCKFNEDDCFYDFEITDVHEFLEAMLEAHNGYVEDDSYWDFKPRYKPETPADLISHCSYKIRFSYVYIVYNFYEEFKDIIKVIWDDESDCEKYQLVEGAKLYLSGY